MIYIRVDTEELESAIRDLNIPKSKLNNILKIAINRTARQVKNWLPEEVEDRYYIKRMGKIKSGLKMKGAKVSNPVAHIISNGHANDLYDFNVTSRRYNPSNRPPMGHNANVLRANSPMSLMLKPNAKGDKYRAFVVKYKSGHIAIAQRVPGTRMRDKPHKEGIKNLYSISTPAMLGYEKGVMAKVSPKTEELLASEVAKGIARYLKL